MEHVVPSLRDIFTTKFPVFFAHVYERKYDPDCDPDAMIFNKMWDQYVYLLVVSGEEMDEDLYPTYGRWFVGNIYHPSFKSPFEFDAKDKQLALHAINDLCYGIRNHFSGLEGALLSYPCLPLPDCCEGECYCDYAGPDIDSTDSDSDTDIDEHPFL